MERNCPRCKLHFERIEGHWIGAVGRNTIGSFLLLVAGLAIFFYATYPNIPTGTWVFWFAACFGAIPILFYPNSKIAALSTIAKSPSLCDSSKKDQP